MNWVHRSTDTGSRSGSSAKIIQNANGYNQSQAVSSYVIKLQFMQKGLQRI